MSTFYRQCALSRNLVREEAWIPESFARVGKVLKIKGEDGWHVLRVSDTRLSEDYIKEHRDDYRYQREASDI